MRFGIDHGRCTPQFQCAAFDAAATLEELGEIERDRFETRLTQLRFQMRCPIGHHDVSAVGDQVESEHLGVFAGGDDRVGVQLGKQSL